MSLKHFDDRDVNRILLSLRGTNGAKIFGNCGNLFRPDVNEASFTPTKLMTEKNSVSFTDVIFAAAELGSHKPFKTAMKLWFNWDSLRKHEGYNFLNDTCKSYSGACDTAGKERVLKIMNSYNKNTARTPGYIDEAYETLLSTILDPALSRPLEYEARVYSFITENIIMKNISPNFLPLYSANECDIKTILDSLSAYKDFEGKSVLVNKITNLRAAFGDRLKLSFIITGTSDGFKSLYDFVQQNRSTIDDTDMGALVFQLMYALYVLDAFEIMHADLHFGNIFVQVLDKPQRMTFSINGTDVSFTTRYIIKMYDYDASQINVLGKNPKNDSFRYIGRTEVFRSGLDYSHALCNLANLRVKVVDDILKALDVYRTASILAGSSSSKLTQRKTIVTTREFVTYLKSLKVYNVGDDGSRYYRIDKVEFEKRFPRDVPAVRTFFSDDYDITKTISFALDPTGNEITIYQRWQCTGANDYNINDISTLFTPEKLAVFARFLSDTRVPGHTVLRYTFERPTPGTLFVPPVSLKGMFDIIQRDISRKPIAKRAIEDDVREPVAPLPKRADIFSRPPSARVGRAVTRAAIERVSPKPIPVASKPPAKRIHREPSPRQVDARVISKSPAKRARKVTPGRQAARVVTPGRRLFRVSPKRSARKVPERKQGWGTYFKNMLGLNVQESQRRGKGYRDIGY